MEKLKPQKQRSVISSLKFQRKTDYQKFLKFIKLETKRLKGIEKPKESKVKDILNVGTIGLSTFGIFSLIGKGRDAINKIKGVQDNFQTPFAIGRVRDTDLKKTISINDSIRTSPINKKKFSPFISQKIKVKEKSPLLEKPIKVEQPSFFTKKLTVKKKLVQTPSRTPFTPIETPVTTGSGSGSGQGGEKKPPKYPPNKGTSKIDYGTYVYKPKKGLSVEDFLKRQDTYINEMKKKLSYQTTRADQLRRAYGTAGFEGESSAGAGAGGASRKPSFKQPTLDDLLFGKDGDKPLKVDKPLKMRAEMVFDYTKTRLSQLKSKGSKLFDSISKTTQNLTPQFLKSDLVKPLFKSKTKTGFFVIDLLFAGQAFADLFKPKDNLRTSVVDLFNAYNNLKYKDDPSKLKYYITESSDERIRAYYMQKNKEIRLLKEKAGVNLGGPQNILIVPENKENNEVKSNIPITKGGTEISFVPIEPLNSVGTDILLHKLNA